MSNLLQNLGEAPELDQPLVRAADPSIFGRPLPTQPVHFPPQPQQYQSEPEEDLTDLWSGLAKVQRSPEGGQVVSIRLEDLMMLMQQQQPQPGLTHAEKRLAQQQERIRQSFANGSGTTFNDPIALRLAGGACSVLIFLVFLAWTNSQTPTQQQYSQTAEQLKAIERLTVANQRALEETTARSQKLAAEAIKRPGSVTCVVLFGNCPNSQGQPAPTEYQPVQPAQPAQQQLPAPYIP